ncbi:zinc finger CCCH domain-containing protein 40 [Selaginella moellendorffii]|nr:zinc finger CCCH domain-containing protein 40 [Selaginella moellendorffii]|eukprot:XP_002986095.2 zinc finger CCCH domain-containing protein 40 [Selaginella moellendorffii]
MAHRLLRDLEADGWERSDFPIICETCLGDNPYVRMTKANFDKECKICARPFTVFRWKAGRDSRYKKTEICQTCSKLKNVCQVCVLDLEYGLPVQARDSALGVDTNDVIPKSDVNREYFAEEHDRKVDHESSFGKVRPNDMILKLQRTSPYYKRNRAHICSFFVRGGCQRGDACPYRHEMPVTGELSQQNIKDRYYGLNDPVAAKLLKKAEEMSTLTPPDDTTVRTLYVGGLDERVTTEDLKDNFYSYGEIESLRLVPQRACAFITYTTREDAEKAAEDLAHKLVVNGVRLKLMWGKPQAAKSDLSSGGGAQEEQSNEDGGAAEQDGGAAYYLPPPAPLSDNPYYPSMDPQRMGSVPFRKDEASSSNSLLQLQNAYEYPEPQPAPAAVTSQEQYYHDQY